MLRNGKRFKVYSDSVRTIACCLQVVISYIATSCSGTDAQRERIRQSMKNLFSVWNSGFSDQSGTLYHVCPGKHCCPAGRVTTLIRMTCGITGSVLNTCPSQLSLSKWLDLPSNCSWYLVSLIGNLLGHMLEFALRDLKAVGEDALGDLKSAMEDFTLDVQWHKVAGVRVDC